MNAREVYVRKRTFPHGEELTFTPLIKIAATIGGFDIDISSSPLPDETKAIINIIDQGNRANLIVDSERAFNKAPRSSRNYVNRLNGDIRHGIFQASVSREFHTVLNSRRNDSPYNIALNMTSEVSPGLPMAAAMTTGIVTALYALTVSDLLHNNTIVDNSPPELVLPLTLMSLVNSLALIEMATWTMNYISMGLVRPPLLHRIIGVGLICRAPGFHFVKSSKV